MFLSVVLVYIAIYKPKITDRTLVQHAILLLGLNKPRGIIYNSSMQYNAIEKKIK